MTRTPSPRHRWPAALFCPLLAAAAGLGACSTLQSVDTTTATPADRKGAYFDYGVANSVFTIQISADGGGAGSASAPAAAAVAPTGAWTIAGTLTPAGTPPAAKGAKGDAAPADTAACTVNIADYQTTQQRLASLTGRYIDLKSRLASMSTGVPATGDDAKGLAALAKSYVEGLRVLKDSHAVARAKDSFDQIVKACPPKVKVSIQQAIVTDPGKTFSLRGRTNVFYADQVNLKVDANGLLTTGAPTTQSQVGEIAVALAKDIGMVVAPTPGTSNYAYVDLLLSDEASALFTKGPDLREAARLAAIKALSDAIAALSNATPDTAPEAASKLLDLIERPESMKSLPGPALPISVYGSIKDLENVVADAKAGKSTAPFSDYGVAVDFSCNQRSKTPATVAEIASQVPESHELVDDQGYPAKTGVYDGLVVSASSACHFAASQTVANSATPTVLARANFWAQDSRHLKVLPTGRGFLVSRAVEYDFASGQPTGVTDNRPSEGLALVALPGNVVGGLISGVTSAFTNRKTVTDLETAEVTSKNNLLTAQTTYQAALVKAKADAAAAAH